MPTSAANRETCALDAFGEGEAVLLEGAWSGTTLIATGLVPQCQPFEGIVETVAGDSVVTSTGRIIVPSDLSIEHGASQTDTSVIQPGVSIWAAVRDDARLGVPVARKVAVR